MRTNSTCGTPPRGNPRRGLVEGVGEDRADRGLNVVLAVDRHRAADRLGEEAGVVEAEEVVGVGVGEGDRVGEADPLAEELEPQLGRRVDQEPAGREVEQDARPRPFVPRVVRAADGAVAAEDGHAGRGPAAEERQSPGEAHDGAVGRHARNPGGPGRRPDTRALYDFPGAVATPLGSGLSDTSPAPNEANSRAERTRASAPGRRLYVLTRFIKKTYGKLASVREPARPARTSPENLDQK